MLLITAIFLVSSATAFPALLDVEKRSASPGDPAEFTLDITNNETSTQSFRADPRGPNLRWFHTDGPLTLQPGETGRINISVDPSSDAFQHNWDFSLRVWMTATNQFETVSSYYRVERSSELDLRSSELEKESIRPGETNRINLTVRNLGSELLEDYSIRMNYMNTTEEQTGSAIISGTSSSPPGERSFSFEIPTEAEDRPMSVPVEIELVDDGEVQETVEYSFTIEEVENITHNQQQERTFFSMQKTVSARNNGNVDSRVEINEDIPSYLVPVTAYDVEPNTTEGGDGQTQYTWSQTLAPEEELSVSYRINYWIPLAVLLLVSTGIIGLQKLKRDVSFVKHAKKDEEGIRVRLVIENRSDRIMEDVKVKDFVQNVADVSREFDMAKPILKKTDEGTELKWDIDKLLPGEQRIMEYVLVPKIEVEGGLTLQGAELVKEEELLASTEEVETEFNTE